MIITACTAGLALLMQEPTDKPLLELYQQRFVIRTATELLRVPLVEYTPPPPAVMFRRNDAYVVWDERGLTVRNGDWSYTTRLEELAVSPKLRSRAEIQRTLKLVEQKEQRLEAFAISGMRRLGNYAYIVPRWEDTDGVTWLEALVSVDLTAEKPKPKLEGKFGGISIASEPIDDRLLIQADRLVLPVNAEDGWGFANFDPAKLEFGFERVGDRLLSLSTIRGETLFVEHTKAGNSVASYWQNGTRSNLLTSPGVLRPIDDQTPELFVGSSPAGRRLIWPKTSKDVRIGPDDEVRRVGKYVLTWTPPEKPAKATLYDPDTWTVLAQWTKN